MKNTDLTTVIEKAMLGDNQAFVLLCESKGRDILYNCIRLMGNQHDGEDAAQEVFIRMQKSIAGLQNPDAFGFWMHRIIQNTCQNIRRSASRTGSTLDVNDYSDILKEAKMDFLPSAFVENQEQHNMVMQSLHILPSNYQEVLYLFYFEELSHEEIAQLLDVTKNTVDHTLRRARRALRKQVERGGVQSINAAFSSPALTAALLKTTYQQDMLRLIPKDMVDHAISVSGVAAVTVGTVATGAATTVAGGTVAATSASTMAAGTAATAGAAISATAAGAIATAVAVGGVAVAGAAIVLLPYTGADVPTSSFVPFGEALVSSVFETGSLHSADVSVPLLDDPPASESPQVADASGLIESSFESEAGRAMRHTYSGTLQFVNKENEIVEGTPVPEDCTLQVWQGGTMVAEAAITPDGTYSFATRREGTLLLAGTAQGLQLAQPVTLAQLRTTDGTLTYTDTQAPTGYILLLDGKRSAMADSVVNPRGAMVESFDATEVTLAWHVQAAGGDIVAIKDGTPLATAFQSLPASPEGNWYTLHCTIEDTAGNTTELQKRFVLLA